MKIKMILIKKFPDFDLYCYDSSSIYLLLFKDDIRMSLSFMRFQENYESPKFRGKYFDSLEYIEWYCKSRDQKYFSYMEDWGGFNIPNTVVERMMENLDDFSRFEKNIIDSNNKIRFDLESRSKKVKKYYLIGALSGDESTIDHELSHGLWHTNIKYKRNAKKLVSEIGTKNLSHLYFWLKEVGYHKSVFDDEITAYLSTGMKHEVKGLKKNQIDKMTKPFIENFNLFKNEL
jgi:hypothetical protein